MGFIIHPKAKWEQSDVKNKSLLLLPLILTGCTMSDSDMRKAYSNHYQQPAGYVAIYKEKIAGMDSDALAKYAAAEEKKNARPVQREN